MVPGAKALLALQTWMALIDWQIVDKCMLACICLGSQCQISCLTIAKLSLPVNLLSAITIVHESGGKYRYFGKKGFRG